jgi:DNA integrity scanning protein DisA with diadenylate cyclase activity
VVERFGELAEAAEGVRWTDLADISGISEQQAQAIKDTLDRLTESSILDQYT